ncbi:hypothetical protein ACFX5E_04590 [Flavobacterium sp. LS2P90]|uniref:UmuC domain-containing protein n=1 Tax=Flavobacterium xylosi TaxID=3230415 RepID=A0ABW6HTM9_9FLAO
MFQPKFSGKPVAILSNNDGCVISRSNEVKVAGIPMDAPAFQIKEMVKEMNVQLNFSRKLSYGLSICLILFEHFLFSHPVTMTNYIDKVA